MIISFENAQHTRARRRAIVVAVDRPTVVVVVVLVAAAAATIEAATLPSPATVGAPSQPAASSAAARHPQQPPQPQQLGQVIRQQDVESRDGREVPTAVRRARACACRAPRCVGVCARDSPVSSRPRDPRRAPSRTSTSSTPAREQGSAAREISLRLSEASVTRRGLVPRSGSGVSGPVVRASRSLQ